MARHHGIPLRTVKRWAAQYRDSGLAWLARRARGDRGSQRELPAELKQVIEGLALRKPPPTVAFVHRQACDAARQQGWKAPACHSVYRIVKQLDPALLTLAHEGSKAYRLAFDLLHRLIAQIACIMEINELATITTQVVEAARESLVIGTA